MKIKKMIGKFGTVYESDNSGSDARVFDYKVNVPSRNGAGMWYIWWRILDKDGNCTLRRLEGNGAPNLKDMLNGKTFNSPEEAVSYADECTEEVIRQAEELMYGGMDASWTQDDIDSYNNFGDSIIPKSFKKKVSKMKQESFSDMVNKQRKKNNGVMKGYTQDELDVFERGYEEYIQCLIDALNKMDEIENKYRSLIGDIFLKGEGSYIDPLCDEIQEMIEFLSEEKGRVKDFV